MKTVEANDGQKKVLSLVSVPLLSQGFVPVPLNQKSFFVVVLFCFGFSFCHITCFLGNVS